MNQEIGHLHRSAENEPTWQGERERMDGFPQEPRARPVLCPRRHYGFMIQWMGVLSRGLIWMSVVSRVDHLQSRLCLRNMKCSVGRSNSPEVAAMRRGDHSQNQSSQATGRTSTLHRARRSTRVIFINNTTPSIGIEVGAGDVVMVRLDVWINFLECGLGEGEDRRSSVGEAGEDE